MTSYGNEMLVRGRIDDLLREAARERLAREARARSQEQTRHRWRDGRRVTIGRWARVLVAWILREADAPESDGHGAAAL